MKKVLLAILIVFVATTVWAGSSVDPTDTTKRVLREREYQVIGTPQVKFDLSGEFSAQGYYWDNYALASDDTVTNTFYKGYLPVPQAHGGGHHGLHEGQHARRGLGGRVAL